MGCFAQSSRGGSRGLWADIQGLPRGDCAPHLAAGALAELGFPRGGFLVLNAEGCPGGVGVSREGDGGFSSPVIGLQSQDVGEASEAKRPWILM